MMSIPVRIAAELAVRPEQIHATIKLLDEGATVPFIARYRKEVTGELDDTQLRLLEERLRYMRELETRREAVLASVEEQGKLTPELAKAMGEAETKTLLEDLYLPYKKKRRTKAQIAREAGLAPLAEGLLGDPNQDPETFAQAYVDADKGIADTKAALDGARQILMEAFAEDAPLVGQLRDTLWDNGGVEARVVAGKEAEGQKFRDYFDYNEDIRKIPSHRALALFRGRNEGILRLNLLPEGGDEGNEKCEARIASRFGIKDLGRPADRWLKDTVRWTWRIKMHSSLSLELMGRVREAAEEEAIKVFADNLRDLLLAAPAGAHVTLGLDPGLRTGVKVVVVDATGKLVDMATIYPHVPRNDWNGSLQTLAALIKKHSVDLIAIGNGTASRETEKLCADLIKQMPGQPLSKIVVSEAGASVYSASELAANEFPDVDVSIRGAVSIARRLQDPLAELVKIEPKAIGVGQYQHDVSQTQLSRALDAVVEDCVNAVGVDLNQASAPLLQQVSGLSRTLSRNIVEYRDREGAFSNRKQLKKVPRLGAKAYEQAAGFLRITGGDNPLDASSVHPEAYPLVKKILGDQSKDVKAVLGNPAALSNVRAGQYVDDVFGLPTVMDVLAELGKPGRDPRPEFKTASFQEGVEQISDLKEDMILEGVVTNVTNFGAFIDIGVHQDGLVHISALADKFVKDPREVVKAGDVVKVKVMEVDAHRKRIALTMRLSDAARDKVSKADSARAPKVQERKRQEHQKPMTNGQNMSTNGAMAEALGNAFKRR